ncbi:hypothetical protein J5N97_020728 [Dioscorea zingiberensis]|uniref:Uncharacterized protein n=1 Tax=Dioscorea zingiberensis TaxID=325984 RepID=A0A9D5HDQ1_9LILI|nr:hypothetical protein J5N97_020728 [Dioscorea zingiberensis]
MEVIKRLIGLSQLDAVVELLDRSLLKRDGTLLDEDDAQCLLQLMVGIDCFMSLKILLLLPYEVPRIQCLHLIEATLKDESISMVPTRDAEKVCVDKFLTTQSFVDIASISVVSGTTGGQVYHYYPFSALSGFAKLYNDLRWNICRPQRFEAVIRVRCSEIDCDKAIMVTFKHDNKFQEGSECAFQCALLYTTLYADLDTRFAYLLKQASSGIPTSPLSQVQEQITNLCISILHSFRKYWSTVSSSRQLILPETLKLLPLYTLVRAFIGLRNDGWLDDWPCWVCHAASRPISLVVPLVYPRMIAIHDLTSKDDDEDENKSFILSAIPLSFYGFAEKVIQQLILWFVKNCFPRRICSLVCGITLVHDSRSFAIPEKQCSAASMHTEKLFCAILATCPSHCASRLGQYVYKALICKPSLLVASSITMNSSKDAIVPIVCKLRRWILVRSSFYLERTTVVHVPKTPELKFQTIV